MAYELRPPAHPSPAERTALAELGHYLGQAAGRITAGGREVVIQIRTDTALAPEAWRIQADNAGNIFFSGGSDRGILYGVYHFLEWTVGIHWWNPFEEYIPPRRDFDLTGLKLAGEPFFRLRNIYRNSQFPPDGGRWAARNRINQDGDSKIGAEYGGAAEFGSPYHVHTIARDDGYLPEKDYLDGHPEYYALINGKRQGSQEKGQICFSNPDLPQLFTDKLRRYITSDERRAEHSGTPVPTVYDISINDNIYFCTCDRCAVMAVKDNPSGVMLQFINRIADSLTEYRPGHTIQTAAYFATLEPPVTTRARDNVLVRLCDTYSYLTEDILSPANRPFHDILQKWGAKADHLAVWEYAITFDDSAGLPYASEYTYGVNMAFYAANKITGLIIEHEFPDVSDMYDLKVWLEAKLLEDPSLDLNMLLNTFYEKYYGPAASPVRAYRERLLRAAQERHFNAHYFSPGIAPFRYIDYTTMTECQQLMNEAEKLAGNDESLLFRIRRARFGIDLGLGYTLRGNMQAGAKAAGADMAEFDHSVVAAQERFLATWRKSATKLVGCGQTPLRMDYIADIIAARHSANAPGKLPKELQGADVLIFAPENWQIHPTRAKFSPAATYSGTAIQINPADQSQNPVRGQVLGIYNQTTTATIASTIAEPTADEFHWYQLNTVPIKLEANHYLYATNAWELQFSIDALADYFPGRKVVFYVEMRPGRTQTAQEVGSIAVRLL